MATRSYYTVGGRIIGERSEGQPRVDYLTGPVGSVTATTDENGQVVNRYRYKPYGALLSKTGAGADPMFLWVGAFGYRQTTLDLTYIRARHYSPSDASFTSIAPLFARADFGESSHGYALANPVTVIDPSGNLPAGALPAPVPCAPAQCCCCVDGLKYANLRGTYVAPELSVFFDVIASYFYKITNTGPTDHCTLEWWEYCDQPSVSGKIREWVDLNKNEKLQEYTETLRKWKYRAKPCPGRPKPLTLPEAPSLKHDTSLPHGYNEKKRLCIKVIIRSSPGCDCATKALSLSIFVRLRFESGRPAEAYFESPARDPFCFEKPLPGG